MRVTPTGNLEAEIYPRYDLIPASEQLFVKVKDGDTVLLVCTPARYAFATLDDLREA